MAVVGSHSNLALHAASQQGNAPRHISTNGVTDSMSEDIDDTPKYVAAIGIGAVVLMLLLKQAGFRFSFGVKAGR